MTTSKYFFASLYTYVVCTFPVYGFDIIDIKKKEVHFEKRKNNKERNKEEGVIHRTKQVFLSPKCILLIFNTDIYKMSDIHTKKIISK